MISVSLHHFNRKLDISTKVFRHLLRTNIVKNYVKSEGDKFLTDKLVSVNIRVYDKKIVKSKYSQHFQFSGMNTELLPIATFVVDTLKDVAYTSIRQVANVAVARLVGDVRKIEIEIMEL